MSKTVLQIFSDIHLEFAKYNFIPSTIANIVIDAGDLCSRHPNIEYTTLDFAKDVTKTGKTFIHVPGNHEYYNGDFQNKPNYDLTNFYVLDNKSVIIDGIKFIGSTLWSDVDDYTSNFVNDTKMIQNGKKRLTSDDIREEFKKNVEFLVSELSGSKKNIPIVVITHYLPSFQSIHPKYKHCGINTAFASDLNDIILKYSPELWIHGHTHCSMDYKIGNTRIVCNPRGYTRRGITENSEFKDVYEVCL